MRDKDTSGVEKTDDVIRFQTLPHRPDVIDILTTFNGKEEYQYKYSLPRERCTHYARTIVRSLVKDDDPFEALQITSSLFPAVLFPIKDLEKDSTMYIIDDMFNITFTSIVTCKTSKPKDEEVDME